MKNYIIFGVFIFCTWTVQAFAHTPLLMIQDNEDGTLTAQGGFSTGAGARGIDLYLKTKKEEKILFHQKFPNSSSLTIKIPQEPYMVIFDGGPGHKIVKDGPAPPKGFTVNVEAVTLHPEKSSVSGLPVSWPMMIILIVIAAVLVSIIPKFSVKK